jgi:hypothetical protein
MQAYTVISLYTIQSERRCVRLWQHSVPQGRCTCGLQVVLILLGGGYANNDICVVSLVICT